MFPLIELYLRGGLSQKQFCMQHGLSFGAFHYWHKKYKAEQQTTDHDGFAEVQVRVERERSIVIRYTSGTAVHIPL